MSTEATSEDRDKERSGVDDRKRWAIMKRNSIKAFVLTTMLVFALTACATTATTATTTSTSTVTASAVAGSDSSTASSTAAGASSASVEAVAVETTVATASATAGTPLLTVSDLYSERDLEQEADLTDATTIDLVSGTDVSITEEGVYVLKGTAENVTVTVEAAEDAKVQIVLDGASITNTDAPAIYVKSADKVFVTTTSATSHLETTGAFVADGDTNLDAVIFSRSDIVLNGTGTLEIVSAQGNGVSSKDDLKVTGGTYDIKTSGDALEANEGILLYAGTLNIDSGKDAVHAENSDDTSTGYVHIGSANLTVTAVDDAIQGTTIVQIDGGSLVVNSCAEGIEGTTIQINGGDITINSSDDGINATNKGDGEVVIEVNGGNISVTMGSGDTDGFDANGSIRLVGGTISVNGNSAFDADNGVILTGSTVTVNGEVVTEIATQSMGHGGMGGSRPARQ